MGGKAGQGGCRAHPQGSTVRKPWCAVRLTRPASGSTPWGGRGDPVTSLPPQPLEATSPPVPPLAVPSLHFPSSSPHRCKSSLLHLIPPPTPVLLPIRSRPSLHGAVYTHLTAHASNSLQFALLDSSCQGGHGLRGVEATFPNTVQAAFLSPPPQVPAASPQRLLTLRFSPQNIHPTQTKPFTPNQLSILNPHAGHDL